MMMMMMMMMMIGGLDRCSDYRRIPRDLRVMIRTFQQRGKLYGTMDDLRLEHRRVQAKYIASRTTNRKKVTVDLQIMLGCGDKLRV